MEKVSSQSRKRSKSRRKKRAPRKDNDDESSVEASPIERESNTAGKLTIEDESRLEEDVKAVLEELLCAVQDQIDREKKTETQYDNTKGRRGAKRRVSYDIIFKATVLKDLKRGKTRPVDVAEKHKIHKSLVTKWQKQENEIMEAASKDHKKVLKRRRPKSTKKKNDKV